MKKLKKALSMALALTLSLAMAVPAFAAENNWDLAVNGESDTAAWMKEKTFTLRSWSFSDYDENDMRTVTQTDTEEFTTNCLCLNKGDVMVITNGGEEFDCLSLMAWSDPDGDGVYDNRLMKGSEIFHPSDDGESPGYTETPEEIVPADIAGPLVSSEPFGGEEWYFNYFALQIDGSINSGEGIFGDGTELRLPVDKLLDEFGTNTLVWITVDGENGWYVLVEDGASAPSGAAAYKVSTSGKKGLNVRGGPGTNYKKVGALAENAVTYISEIKGQWGKLADGTGWAFMPGLKAVSAPVTTPTTPETPEQTFPITMVVKNSKGALNVRTGPGTSYKLAGPSLKNGTVIEIAETQGQWGKLANDAGWVYLPGAKTVNG